MNGNLPVVETNLETSSFADFTPPIGSSRLMKNHVQPARAERARPGGSGRAEGAGPRESRPSSPSEERGEHSNGGWHRESDRRRSDRLAVSIPVRLEDVESLNGIEGAELVMVELSLGGATLETASRPPLFVPRRLSLGFGEIGAELTILPYHCWLHQLFYAPSRSSRVLYRVRVTFQDPSVPALNLIYRILLAHWNGES
jgi:hypothetical protein